MDAFTRRLLLVVLWVFTAAVAAGVTAIILVFVWAATRRDGTLLVTAHWLIRADWAALAVVVACAVALWRHRVRDRD